MLAQVLRSICHHLRFVHHNNFALKKGQRQGLNGSLVNVWRKSIGQKTTHNLLLKFFFFAVGEHVQRAQDIEQFLPPMLLKGL